MCAARLPIILLTAALALAAMDLLAADGRPDAVMADPALAVGGAHEGATVLWGGRIVDRSDDHAQDCLEVAAAPLDRRTGRPLADGNGQHFYACSESRFDATRYAIGRSVTVAGTLGPVQERIVPGSCWGDPTIRGHDHFGTQRMPTIRGCKLDIPVVAVSDSRAFVEPPRAAIAPDAEWAPGGRP